VKKKKSLEGYTTEDINDNLGIEEFTGELYLGGIYKNKKTARDSYESPAWGYTSKGIKFKKVRITIEERGKP